MAADESLQITEIYLSIQGESRFAGLPCVFVRTTGCPLRCVWCDTAYAFHGGERMGLAEILQAVREYGVPLVELTGGEPLAQAAAPTLLRALCEAGFTVLLETSGALDIAPVDRRVHIVMDVKCPDSGMADRMHWPNLRQLKRTDEVKFVLASRRDYEYAREVIRRYDLGRGPEVLLSVAYGLLEPREVVSWLLADRLPARFQLQIHKFIWEPDTPGV